LINRLDEFLRHRTARNIVDELIARPGLLGI
jgi:hypothetical protein